MLPAPAPLSWPWIAAIGLFALAQALLLLYSAHRLVTLWRCARGRRQPLCAAIADAHLPRVTVQLPVFNERAVVERLIDAAAALDYPAHLLQIQVLDDSTDDTLARARARVEHWRGRGVNIALEHRAVRTGFKAGALAAGMEGARGEFIAVFDADFVPAADFLRRIVPRFADARVGMVQARWGHLNRAMSMLTSAQATLLDAHFLLEHEARMAAGLFFNFNGTAGVWRRMCIEDAGGWSHDTLTEDLDLSYRAQLRGWRFVSAADIEVPGELPADVLALKSQQRRWTKGSIQTARKVLPGLLRSALPAPVKLEAVLHLTGNLVYPLLPLTGMLSIAVIAVPPSLPAPIAMLLDASAVLCGLFPVLAFLNAGQHAAGRPHARMTREVVSALVIGAGLTLNNALAVLGGLHGPAGEWERTPKTGDAAGTRRQQAYPARDDRGGYAELLLAALFAAVAAFALHAGRLGCVPLPLLLSAGLARMGTLSLQQAFGDGAAFRVGAGGRGARELA